MVVSLFRLMKNANAILDSKLRGEMENLIRLFAGL